VRRAGSTPARIAESWLDAWFSAPTRERLRQMVDSLNKN
jgi:hypothetical protein